MVWLPPSLSLEKRVRSGAQEKGQMKEKKMPNTVNSSQVRLGLLVGSPCIANTGIRET